MNINLIYIIMMIKNYQWMITDNPPADRFPENMNYKNFLFI